MRYSTELTKTDLINEGINIIITDDDIKVYRNNKIIHPSQTNTGYFIIPYKRSVVTLHRAIYA